LLTLCFSALPAQAKYGGGTGEPNDPYLIYDANQMNAIGADANDWDRHFKLMADIDLAGFTGTSFNIIGYCVGSWEDDKPFTGVFDGSGHTISNFTYTTTGTDYIGIFGYVTGEIKEVGLIDPNVDAGTGGVVGSLVGYLVNGTVSDCYVEGGSVSGHRSIGGLWGKSWQSTITNCYSTGSVAGNEYVGGMVGGNSYGSITNCYSSGDVSGGSYVGGLAGGNFGNISDCYATGSVSGDDTVGGLVGNNGNLLWEGTIANCYSISSVTGTTNIGGLVGFNMFMVSTSFWDIETSGQDWSDGGTGLPTAEMQMAHTFIFAGWNFQSIWWILEGVDYPRLCWEEKYGGGSGQPNNPYLIYTAEQMNTIGACQRDWDKHFKLMANIDLSAFTGTSFNIIGTYPDNPFTGVFDGSGHTISNFNYTVIEDSKIGLFGYINSPNAQIKDLELIDPNIDAGVGDEVGSLVGCVEYGTVANCYVEGGSVSGNGTVGGLVGSNYAGEIFQCHATSSVSGYSRVGGLAGENNGTITSCYSSADVRAYCRVGGLVGFNWGNGTITNSYAAGSVSGNNQVGGLVGWNWNTISNCYATSGISGVNRIGGLVGSSSGTVTASFWDTETSGQTTSDGGTGLPTAEMQTMNTFMYAGWDFITPVWTIDEGVDYPRLWWELVPVLHAEPEITLGTSNTITWDPVPGANDYYAECAEDANFTSILYNSGWITETSYEFTGLQLGQMYWYSVKARNTAGVETGWSNVESSLQVTLADAVDMTLDPDTLKNKNMKNALLNKINAVQQMFDKGRYEEALNKLQNDILQKTNGCAETGRPDKNDWIITCEGQSQLYPLIIEAIELLENLI